VEPDDPACLSRIRRFVVEEMGYVPISLGPARSVEPFTLPALIEGYGHLRIASRRAPLRHEGDCWRAVLRWQPLRRVQTGIWQDTHLRLRTPSADLPWASSPTRKRTPIKPITKAASASSRRCDLYGVGRKSRARFIMDCNQNLIPLIFFHDVNGFMVGRGRGVSGIIKAGAMMVNAVSNSVVPGRSP